MRNETAKYERAEKAGRFLGSIFKWQMASIFLSFAIVITSLELRISTSEARELWKVTNGDVLYFAIEASRTLPENGASTGIFLLVLLAVFILATAYTAALFTLSPLVMTRILNDGTAAC